MNPRSRNICVDKAIEIKNQIVSEIVDREFEKSDKDPNYEHTYTLKDLNRIKDSLDQIKHHVWIRDNILIDNGYSVFNIPRKNKRDWKVPN